MSHINIIRAWKDDEYRRSLSDAEHAALPENPAGALLLTDADLGAVAGAATAQLLTLGCCNGGLTSDPGLCSLACDTGESTCSRNMSCPKVIDEQVY